MAYQTPTRQTGVTAEDIRRAHPEWYNPDGSINAAAFENGPITTPAPGTAPAPGTTAPGGTTAPTTGGGGEKYGWDAKAIFDKYTSQIDYTAPDALDQLERAMRADGIQVERRGDLFKIPGTQAGYVDILQNKANVEGRGPVRGWAYQPFYDSSDFDRLVSEGRNPHTGEMALPGQRFSRDQDAPISGPGSWTGQYGQSAVGMSTGGGRYPMSSVQGVGFMAPWNTPFRAPTGTEDPGYAFRMNEAQKALEKSAAAKGTMRTGGFVKDLAGYMQGLASQEYANAYQRALGEYNLAYGIFDRNQANQFNRTNTVMNMGLNAANAASGQGTSFAQNAGNTITNAGDAQAKGIAGQNVGTQEALKTAGGLWNKEAWDNPFNNKGSVDASNPHWMTTGQGS